MILHIFILLTFISFYIMCYYKKKINTRISVSETEIKIEWNDDRRKLEKSILLKDNVNEEILI